MIARRRLVVASYRLRPPGWSADLHLRAAVISGLRAGKAAMTMEHVELCRPSLTA
jgi:hypothetical protein